MNDELLSAELALLEQQLATRPKTEPDAGLRARIVAVANQRTHARAAPMSWVEFAVVTAAAVLLCANLSLSLANQTDFGLDRRFDDNRLNAEAQQIAQLLPDTSPREAMQEALVLQFGTRLIPSREPPPMGGLRMQEWPARDRRDP